MAVPLLGKSALMSILSLADAHIHIAYEKQGINKMKKLPPTFFNTE
jgi:hypothetical protein